VRTLSPNEMMELEQRTFRDFPAITAENLMDAVGLMLAEVILEEFAQAREFVILVGKGNNGGDGLVLARALATHPELIGAKITVCLAFDKLGDLPDQHLATLRHQFPQVILKGPGEPIPFPNSDGLVIDALLGVQARGGLRAPLDQIVAAVNKGREERFFRTIAIDLPSGLAAYSEAGSPIPEPNGAIISDLTLTVGFPKTVLAREALSAWVGRVIVLPWSQIEPDSLKDRELEAEMLTPQDLCSILPRRNALSFKNNYGHLFIVAGSPGFSGAPVLCAHGAQAIGAGLVSVKTHRDMASIVAAQLPPEMMIAAWDPGRVDQLKSATCAVVGPGVESEAKQLLETLLSLKIPLVIDAGALNALAEEPSLLNQLSGHPSPLILTPHPGEMARLIGRKFKADERERVAREFVEKHRVVLLLKGTRTLITAPGKPFYYNTTGNPGLSTGGSGDTLSGVIGGLLSQGVEAIEAAKLGTWLCGRAADLCLRERGCEEGMSPTLVVARISEALVGLRRAASDVVMLDRVIV
jgi:NAD(P)H-hydrate epimerase